MQVRVLRQKSNLPQIWGYENRNLPQNASKKEVNIMTGLKY
jgi:hypothetical protein